MQDPYYSSRALLFSGEEEYQDFAGERGTNLSQLRHPFQQLGFTEASNSISLETTKIDPRTFSAVCEESRIARLPHSHLSLLLNHLQLTYTHTMTPDASCCACMYELVLHLLLIIKQDQISQHLKAHRRVYLKYQKRHTEKQDIKTDSQEYKRAACLQWRGEEVWARQGQIQGLGPPLTWCSQLAAPTPRCLAVGRRGTRQTHQSDTSKLYLCQCNNSHGFMNHWIKQPTEKSDHFGCGCWNVIDGTSAGATEHRLQ